MDQWRARLAAFLDLPLESIGHIGGGKTTRTGEIDVAVIQSLQRKGDVRDLARMFHRRSDFVVLGVPVRFGGHCGGVRAGSRPGCGDRGGLVASDSPSENAIRTQFDRSAKCATGKSFVCRAEFSAQQRSAAQTCPNTCCQG
jgi:hypothetical protein